jgi:hypothetical protein
MTKAELVEKFVKNPGYIKKGAGYLVKFTKSSIIDVLAAKEEARSILEMPRKTKIRDTYQEKLETLKLQPTDVKSVKFWDNMQGEQRFSIQTKNEWYKKEERDEYFENLKEHLSKEIIPVKIPKTPSNKKALMIHTSDKHVGCKVVNSIYENDYNEGTIQERMDNLFKEVVYLTSIYGKFDAIYFNDLGDALDGYNGQTTRGGHKLPQNMDNQQQFDTFVKTTCEFFDKMVNHDLANNYHYHAVTQDNHSGDFSYCANRAIQIYLKCRYPQINVVIMTKFIEHYTYGNHTFMLCHGKDKEDMKHGMPLKINPKVENFILQYIEYYKLTGKLHFIKGDLHTSNTELLRKFRYVNVLSLFGASKWIHNNFGNSNSGVSFDVVEKFTDRIFEHKIIF